VADDLRSGADGGEYCAASSNGGCRCGISDRGYDDRCWWGSATGDGGASEIFAHQICFFHGGSGVDGEIDDLEVRGSRLEVRGLRFGKAKCEKLGFEQSEIRQRQDLRATRLRKTRFEMRERDGLLGNC
jgi:hypothetical protein